MRGQLAVFTSAALVLLISTFCLVAKGAGDSAGRQMRVGVLYPESRSSVPPAAAVFWRRLGELGWVEGRNLTIESRWADGNIERLPAYISELLGRNIDLLVTWTTPAAIAAKAATASSRTPVVVAVMADPIATGIVADLAHPGGNLTGLMQGHDRAFSGKWLEILHDTLPRLSTVAVILNPDNPVSRKQAEALKPAAGTLRVRLYFFEVREAGQLGRTFASARQQAEAFIVLADALTMQHRNEIAQLAAKHRIPGLYTVREFVDAGGLMSYAADNSALFYRAAEYADRILRGDKPGELPIEQATKFELVVNLRTAKALGLVIPQSVLLRADDVIR